VEKSLGRKAYDAFIRSGINPETTGACGCASTSWDLMKRASVALHATRCMSVPLVESSSWGIGANLFVRVYADFPL